MATQHAALHLPELPGERDLDGLRARADIGARMPPGCQEWPLIPGKTPGPEKTPGDQPA